MDETFKMALFKNYMANISFFLQNIGLSGFLREYLTFKATFKAYETKSCGFYMIEVLTGHLLSSAFFFFILLLHEIFFWFCACDFGKRCMKLAFVVILKCIANIAIVRKYVSK